LDKVLQQLFFIKQGLFRDQGDTTLADLLDETIHTLRRSIRNQRPPLLDQGLALALQSLIEEIQREEVVVLGDGARWIGSALPHCFQVKKRARL